MTDAERRAESSALWWAFVHVYHEDHANAAMHTAAVRYSPITFRLAECLSREERTLDLAEMSLGGFLHELVQVQNHAGRYNEDKGR